MTEPAITHPDTARLAARWTRLASLGLLLAAAGALTLVVAILAFGVQAEGEQWFLLAFTMIPLIGALLVNGRGWAWKIGGIVTGFVTAGALFWTAFGLARPASFFDFVPATLVMPGALLGFGASIAAIVRRKTATGAGEKPESRWIKSVLVVAGTAVLLSGLATIFTKRTANPAGVTTYGIRMSDFEFDRPAYDIIGGTTVFVRNDDPFFHTFTVDELGIDVDLGPGSQALVKIPARPGTYLLYCEPHVDKQDAADKGMAATMRVL